jgi:hypothetical protein
MLTKSKLAIAAVLILGAASAAQAGKDVDSDRAANGGYAWGPMGQRMGGSAVNPAYHRRGAHAYAYVPSTRYRHHRDYWDRDYWDWR